jgi:hypothetical protein
MRPLFIPAKHPQLGRLWAAVDPGVRFTEPQLRETRMGAMLAPFLSEAEALAAFQRIGFTVEREHG